MSEKTASVRKVLAKAKKAGVYQIFCKCPLVRSDVCAHLGTVLCKASLLCKRLNDYIFVINGCTVHGQGKSGCRVVERDLYFSRIGGDTGGCVWERRLFGGDSQNLGHDGGMRTTNQRLDYGDRVILI